MGKPPPSQEDEDPTPYLFVSLEQKRIDQSKPYDSKKACWVPDEKDGYVIGEIKATKGDIVSVGIPGGEVGKTHARTARTKTEYNSKIFSFFWHRKSIHFSNKKNHFINPYI